LSQSGQIKKLKLVVTTTVSYLKIKELSNLNSMIVILLLRIQKEEYLLTNMIKP
jgi:hypothetical protein